MTTPPLSDDQLYEAVEAKAKFGSDTTASDALGLKRATFQTRLRIAATRGITIRKQFLTPELPSPDMPIDDLIASRVASFRRQEIAREARALIPVQVTVEGAYGILHMGDPHVDDEGCDWATLQSHKIADLQRNLTPLIQMGVRVDNIERRLGDLDREAAEASTRIADSALQIRGVRSDLDGMMRASTMPFPQRGR